MRLRITSFLLIALAGVGIPNIARAQEVLGLEQAVKLALDSNERARKAPLRVETAEAQLDRARDAFFPTLQAAGSGQYKFREDKTGRNVTTSGTVTLNQPILNPSSFPQYSQAAHTAESERYGGLQDRRVVSFDTARAFLQALASERVLEASVARLDRAKGNLANAEARAAAGLSSINDATRASIELTSSATQMNTSSSRLETAYLNLGFLIGKRLPPPINGAKSALAAPERTTTAAQNFETNPDNQVKLALDRRYDVLSSHEKTAALEQSAKEPLYRLAPTLSSSLQMRVNPDPLPTENALDETATLNLSWNIFDAGLRYADRRQRLAQLQSQALDESLLRRQVDQDIRLALVSLRSAREAFKIADEGVTASQRSVEETEILYKQGLAKAIELSDATAQRFDADVTRASAKLSMEQAYLELRFALGLGPFDDGPPVQAASAAAGGNAK